MRTHRHNLLLAFGAMIHHAPDTGGGSGASSLTIEQQLAEAKSEAAKHKASAEQAENEVTRLKAENQRLESQCSSFEQEATKAKDALTKEQSEHKETKSKLETSDKGLAAANKCVDRLEKLCAVKGLNPSDSVTPASEQPADNSDAGLLAQYNALSDRNQKIAFEQKHRSALRRATKQ